MGFNSKCPNCSEYSLVFDEALGGYWCSRCSYVETVAEKHQREYSEDRWNYGGEYSNIYDNQDFLNNYFVNMMEWYTVFDKSKSVTVLSQKKDIIKFNKEEKEFCNVSLVSMRKNRYMFIKYYLIFGKFVLMCPPTIRLDGNKVATGKRIIDTIPERFHTLVKGYAKHSFIRTEGRIIIDKFYQRRTV